MFAKRYVNFGLSLLILLLPAATLTYNAAPNQPNPSDSIAFPGDFEHNYRMQSRHGDHKEYYTSNGNITNQVPPIDFIYKISNFSVGDLLINYVDDYEEDLQIANRFGDVERSAAVTPKPATCMPELQTVKLITSNDPSILYIPSCTRIERCGGCCSHSLLTCQAKDSETVSFKVIKTQFTGGNRLKFVGKEIIHVEKHTKCGCGCRIQESDCNRFQEYRETECKCVCKNTDEEKKCYKNNNTKLWDPEVCTCQCREEKQCSTGSTYDTNSCKCVPIQMRRRYVQHDIKYEQNQESEPLLPSTIYETSNDNRDPFL